MNISICYFSGTGNTWWVSKKLKETLEKDHIVSMFSVENNDINRDDVFSETHHVIIGYPIYASKMPKPMDDFIKKIPQQNKNITLSVFCTQAIASGDGAYYDKKRFSDKGFDFLQSKHFKMGNNFYLPHLPIAPVKNKEHLQSINNRALIEINNFANSINKNLKSHVNPLGIVLGATQRAGYTAAINIVNKSLGVEKESCTSCLICIKHCPSNNIFMGEDGIEFNKGCIGCVRCYNFCPPKAITLGKKTLNRKKFYRYRGPEPLKVDYIKS